MRIRNSAFNILVISLISIVVFFSCIKQIQLGGDGVLKGKISIGPLCPVERVPPDPACQPTAETYKAWAIAVWTANKKIKVVALNPNLDGTYQVEISAGNYIVDFDVVHANPVGGSNLPTVITITDKDTTILNINIDTGIR